MVEKKSIILMSLIFILSTILIVFEIAQLIIAAIIGLPFYFCDRNNLVKQYVMNCLLGIDHCSNAFTGGAVHETISSRLGRNPDANWFVKFLVWFLDCIDNNHVYKYIERDISLKDEVLK